jgi:hypothetical protein
LQDQSRVGRDARDARVGNSPTGRCSAGTTASITATNSRVDRITGRGHSSGSLAGKFLHCHLLDDNAGRQSEMSIDWFGDLIGLGIRSLIGFGVLFSLLYLSVNLQAKMWRALRAHYCQAKHMPVIARKIPETIVMFKSDDKILRFGWRQNYAVYYWSIISIVEDGLLISAIPPVNLVCKDIYLPFEEMNITPHSWMLWEEPYAISMNQASDLMLIIGQETLRWLRQNTRRAPFHS